MAGDAPGHARDGDDDAAFVAEVLRINDRFNREVVEARNVCPYARGARKAGRVTRRVLLQDDLATEATVAAIAALETAIPPPDVALLIFPRVTVTPREFEHFNAAVRAAADARPRAPRVFVHAVFHPDFPCDQRSPDALVAFFRRTPDPTIQLVRHATLEAVRGEQGHGTVVVDPRKIDWTKLAEIVAPSVSEKITNDNYELVQREGPDAIAAVYAAIRADRAASYARFARP